MKGIPKNMKLDNDFSHRYAGGINQYGTKGVESPDDFQGYMNDGMTQQTTGGKAPTPMSLMSSPTNPNFGPPAAHQMGTLQGAAPENFGPPGVGQTDANNQAKFGAPGFEGNEAQTSNFNAKNLKTPKEKPPTHLGAPTAKNQAPHLEAENRNESPDGSASKGGESGEKPKKTYQEVEKMMTEQMIQGAITRMKINHSDVWKE